MSLVLAALLAVSPVAAPTLAACSWNQPGHNPFMGDVVAAVDRYRDIPPEVRSRLKTRMAARAYDEIVSIRRDSIVGQATYGAEIRDMHFGIGQICGTVNRAAWTPSAQERGLVYCEGEHCILVPTVCRNVSRITRTRPAPAAVAGAAATGPSTGAGAGAPAGAGGGGVAPGASAGAGGDSQAVFGLTPAGPLANGAPVGGADAASLPPLVGTAADPTGGVLTQGVAGTAQGGTIADPGSFWAGSAGAGGATTAIGAGAGGGAGASWLGLAGGIALGGAGTAAAGSLPTDRQVTALPGDTRNGLTDGPLGGANPLPGAANPLASVTPAVPEPATALMTLLGLAAVGCWARRRPAQA